MKPIVMNRLEILENGKDNLHYKSVQQLCVQNVQNIDRQHAAHFSCKTYCSRVQFLYTFKLF